MNIQVKFYDVMEFYLDDMRLAALALFYFAKPEAIPEEIYYSLLDCDYSYTEALEQIVKKEQNLLEWCLEKQAYLDVFGGPIWQPGDEITLERRAWKLTKEADNDQ